MQSLGVAHELAHYWRDLGLIGALLLTYTAQAEPGRMPQLFRRRARARKPGEKVTPRRIARDATIQSLIRFPQRPPEAAGDPGAGAGTRFLVRTAGGVGRGAASGIRRPKRLTGARSLRSRRSRMGPDFPTTSLQSRRSARPGDPGSLIPCTGVLPDTDEPCLTHWRESRYAGSLCRHAPIAQTSFPAGDCRFGGAPFHALTAGEIQPTER